MEWGIRYMEIKIEKLTHKDAVALYEFEIENRTFFEEMVPTRGDDYYKPEIFKSRHENLLEEQANEISSFYLIKDEQGSIVGRINLVDIDASSRIGHLGYRVGLRHTGKGVAKVALKLLLEKALDQNIKQIKAKTTTTNIASQKVLENNGFERTETDDEEKVEMNGQWLKLVNYTWNDRSSH